MQTMLNRAPFMRVTMVYSIKAKTMATKKAAAKKKNKLGVKNSLVNNINARKKKGISRPKKKSTVEKKQYDKMEKGWKK